jgi:hypothetical protein
MAGQRETGVDVGRPWRVGPLVVLSVWEFVAGGDFVRLLLLGAIIPAKNRFLYLT